MAHKHANLMMEYAQDAAETAKPWLRWEYKVPLDNDWYDCTKNPEWDIKHEYRRKPNQAQIDYSAFLEWQHFIGYTEPEVIWNAALAWERSRKK